MEMLLFWEAVLIAQYEIDMYKIMSKKEVTAHSRIVRSAVTYVNTLG
jgi:hypothetical protein